MSLITVGSTIRWAKWTWIEEEHLCTIYLGERIDVRDRADVLSRQKNKLRCGFERAMYPPHLKHDHQNRFSADAGCCPTLIRAVSASSPPKV